MGILDQENQPFDDEALERHIERALAVNRPTGPLFYLAYPLIRRFWTPRLIDAQNIPDEPCLFIGNHSLFATDGMVMLPVIYHEQGRFLRPLGDKALWTSLTEDFLLSQGAAIGHPQVCSAMMEAEQDIMVFPGGAHEATKTQAERYTLQWKDRYGFVKLAAEHGYTIMPWAIVGPDEFYEHLIEGRDLPDTRLGQLLRRAGVLTDETRPDLLPPLPVGTLGTLIPKPQRCFIQFGAPISLARYKGKRVQKKTLMAIREQVADQIEAMLPQLFALRDEARNEGSWLRNLLAANVLPERSDIK